MRSITAAATSDLEPDASWGSEPDRERMTTSFVSSPKTLSCPTWLTTSRSQALRRSLAAAYSRTSPSASPVSAAKPTISWFREAASRTSTSSRRMSGLRTREITGSAVSSRFLILVPETSAGRKSATAAAMITTSESAAACRAALRSSSAVSTRTTSTPPGAGTSMWAASLAGGDGQRDALLAGGPVAQEADRVEGLPGAAGADRHGEAGQRPGCGGCGRGGFVRRRQVRCVGDRGRAGQGQRGGEDRLRFGQAARAGVRAGQQAGGGLKDGDTPAA